MSTGAGFEIRDGRPDDAAELTAMVRGSAAYTGDYRAMVERQVVDEAYMAANPTRVCLDGPTIVGFASLMVPGRGVAGEAELDFMFVANDQQRRGIGRVLMADMIAVARAAGIRRIHIVSHPPSEPFYRAVGAVPAGTIPPAGRTTWARPLLQLDV